MSSMACLINLPQVVIVGLQFVGGMNDEIKEVVWRFRPQVLLCSLDFCLGAKRNASNVACLLNLNASTLKLNALTLFVMEKDKPFVRREEYAG